LILLKKGSRLQGVEWILDYGKTVNRNW
jgi:hypothetical protein